MKIAKLVMFPRHFKSNIESIIVTKILFLTKTISCKCCENQMAMVSLYFLELGPRLLRLWKDGFGTHSGIAYHSLSDGDDQ